MQKKGKFIVMLILLFAFIFSLTTITQAQGLKDAFSVNNDDNKDPLDTVAKAGGYKTDDAPNQLNTHIATIINVVLSMLGIIFLLLMLYGGFLWMTAAGDEPKVTKAKDLIIAAIIGVILIVSAYAISYFIIEKVTTGALEESSATEE